MPLCLTPWVAGSGAGNSAVDWARPDEPAHPVTKLCLLAGAMAAGLMRAAEAWAVNCHHVTSADDLEPLADGLITPRAAGSP